MKIATQDERAVLGTLTILVLEDEMMVAMLLEDMLGDLGCRVVGPVATAEAALAKLEERVVDAALISVMGRAAIRWRMHWRRGGSRSRS
jgi:DNA-binding NarL/FixJ family response regulator